MHYKYESPNLIMSTRRTKMLGLGIAAIAFLLATIPVFHSGVVYADNGDHGDNNNGDHGDNNNGDHGDNNNGDHGDNDGEG